MLYGAFELSSCIVEVSGDRNIIEVGTWVVAALSTTRRLTLLDLRGSAAMRAGTVAAISKESNRQFSQEWSRYFYDHGFIYTMDGIQHVQLRNFIDALVLH